MARDGRVERAVTTSAPLGRHARISPDGESIIVVQDGLNSGNIWRHSLRSHAQPIRITGGPGTAFPIWRPDGREVVFQGVADTGTAMFAIAADRSATGATQLLADDDVIPEDWTPDGASVMSGGFGLSGMRERIESLGGSLVAGPCDEGGWRVLARLPAARPLASSR